MKAKLKSRSPVNDLLAWNESGVGTVELRLSDRWVEVQPNLK